ncbi:cAMP-binding domain of CRP or a regulatory subunit of cAMP-dependent protein kinases [Flavobacterium phragmitis]|uniref:cAMP-binding domain of CRP or a regulatory subunit of cAMP-dependent protein kinases n=2 Tax=Flavobacterium phragmitis TaxID=739143 RepID=A0A1I1TJ98_9FLAO|nr:cAMP-binding domain of CRP or a regulatory subunit of cAMP-dependent protein kinases [Flavobacterium phragmitis]
MKILSITVNSCEITTKMIYEQLSNYIKKNIDVSEDDLNTILSYFKPLKKTKKELLLAQGQISQQTFFVGKGCVRIFFINEEGKDVTRYIAFENQFATALVSFITKNPAQENIQVIEKSELLAITHEDFNYLMKIIPQWREFYSNYLEKAYVNNANRLMSFTTMDALERYNQLLKINPTIVKRLPNKIVASYINISQETLSRLKSKT